MNQLFFNRYLTILGHLTFTILGIMAFVFFKERTVILDASYQSFLILLKNDFAIQVNRFGAVITQIFPLVALRLGASLEGILTAYSLGFVIVHWLMFSVCNHFLKQKELAFSIVLFNVFMVNNTFYWVQNEIIQAISLNFIFWAILLKRASFTTFRWFDYPVLSGILITLAYFHPLIIFPFSFMSIFFILYNFYHKKHATTATKYPLSNPVIFTAFISFLTIYLFKKFITPNNYDTDAAGRLDINDTLGFILKINTISSYHDFMNHILKDFYLLPLAFMIITVFYMVKKHYLKLFFIGFNIIAYTIMVMVAYREGGSWFYVESQYLPMSIFVIVPLVWEIIPSITTHFNNTSSVKTRISTFYEKFRFAIIAIAISLIIFIRLVDIFKTRDVYKKRLDYIGQILDKTKRFEGTKFALEEADEDKQILVQTWGIPTETLYYSALQSPDSTRSIMIFADIKNVTDWDKDRKIFHGEWLKEPYINLNPHLFHFTDTIRGYHIIERKNF